MLQADQLFAMSNSGPFDQTKRPAPADRKFRSEAVDAAILRIKKQIGSPELAWLFENCFPNTLDTTVDFEIINGKPDTYVITGDIDAMWLRDSSAQVWPYLSLVKEDQHLQQMIAGVINRQKNASCSIHTPMHFIRIHLK